MLVAEALVADKLARKEERDKIRARRRKDEFSLIAAGIAEQYGRSPRALKFEPTTKKADVDGQKELSNLKGFEPFGILVCSCRVPRSGVLNVGKPSRLGILGHENPNKYFGSLGAASR